ncbi:hypothetical protein [Azospirillum sp.]|uniref:hypothetical protein n=1 Tax=Azospirillum sp. TaxID=34012 RepID=UPI003D70C5F3
MTALGLAVAIPATFGYNALVRGNKSITRPRGPPGGGLSPWKPAPATSWSAASC